MIATSESNAIENFGKVCEDVIQNCEPIIVTRSNNENIVMISQSEYNSMLENAYIRKSKVNYERLLESVKQAKEGHLHEIDLGDCND